MRGAALYFIKKIPSLETYDGLITTDLMSLSDFKALAKERCPPSLVYFHENQLTYPLAPGEHMDYQFGFTDITTALAADRVVFNSQTHRDAFFERLPKFIKMMPEFRPGWVVEEIHSRTDVLYPGCRFPAEEMTLQDFLRGLPPLIIWNHRWEFDKNPDGFFEALDAVLETGTEFRLALLGETSQKVPKAFIAAHERYGGRIVQYGYVESRPDYLSWLAQGSIVISTAQQENFGIAMVEAIRFGCLPLLPARLAYPEIIPAGYHADVLYSSHQDLIEKLLDRITNFPDYLNLRRTLSGEMARYAWENTIDQYDHILENLAT
jgi:glycosyltransferase involved in cell wall biosynthesis